MDKALIDTSTFFDIRKAPKNAQSTWAQNTIYNLIQYQAGHAILTVSAFTVFEHLDGLHRQGQHVEAGEFLINVLPSLDVIYPDQAICALAAKINSELALTGKTIGVTDTFIAATAVTHQLTLVNANTKHFLRVQASGFPIVLENWRDA